MKLLWRNTFSLLFLLVSCTAQAQQEWRQTLASFCNSEAFVQNLKAFSKNEPSHPSRDEVAQNLLRHLRISALSYTSCDELIRNLESSLREQPDSPLVHEHLLWLKSLIEAMAIESPRSPSVRVAKQEVDRLLSKGSTMAPAEALSDLVKKTIAGHAFERALIEDRVGVSLADPAFAARFYHLFSDGQLTDSLKRLMIGQYLQLRSIFSPTIRQSQMAAQRLAAAGDQGLEIRRARRYANPQNFIRQGWSSDDDMLRLATGDMYERVYRVGQLNTQNLPKSAVEREVLILVDYTSSMQSDGRGEVRDLVVPSYIDQVFTSASLRGEKISVTVLGYADSVLHTFKIKTLAEAQRAFTQLMSISTSIGSSANHSLALITGLKGIIAEKRRLSHLNVVLVTDAEEAVNIGQIKEYTDQLTAGAAGLRIGVSAISLAAGDESIAKLIAEMGKTDRRFLGTAPTLQFFDGAAIERWTGRDWLTMFLPTLGELVWTARVDEVVRLKNLLKQIDLDEVEPSGDKTKSQSELNKGTGLDENNMEGKVDQDLSGENREDSTSAEETDDSQDENPQDSDDKKETKPSPMENFDQKEAPHNWSQDEREDNIPMYKLKLNHGQMPEMLMVARHENLPESLTQGIAVAKGNRDIRAVRLVRDLSNAYLEIETLVPSKIVGGLAGIARFEGYSLSSLEIYDSTGQEVRPFEVYQIVRNGLYIVHFGKNVRLSGNKFFYKAKYVQDFAIRKRSPLFTGMNRAALKQVSQLLETDGLQFNATSLSKLTTRSTVKAEDLEQSIRAAAVYTYDPESNAPPTTQGKFARYQRFLKGGKLHYQCNGASELTIDIFSSYAEAARLNSLFAENVTGYIIKGLSVTKATGHAVAFISDLRVPFSYLKLDATPSGNGGGGAGRLAKKLNLPTEQALELFKSFFNKVKDLSVTATRHIGVDMRAKTAMRMSIKSCEEALLDQKASLSAPNSTKAPPPKK